LAYDVDFSITAGAVTINAARLLVPAFSEAISDYEISRGRVTSLSMLITNNSSALSKGGSIAAGRVPVSVDPFGDVTEQLSRLPPNKVWVRDAEHGAYCWWMPNTDEQANVSEVQNFRVNYSEADYLLAQVRDWPVGASIKVTFRWCVEFYSPDQIFEKEHTPCLTEAYRVHRHILGLMPAATCNPEHEKNFKDYLHTAIQWGKDGASWVADNKELILAGLSILGQLAA